ncbi:hypothetical protein BDQ17DRAFT_1328590 [Cyathus striatus]|nr:hypothetical protein BDQ17DRAFT_1328590 [Cyathus striatus]
MAKTTKIWSSAGISVKEGDTWIEDGKPTDTIIAYWDEVSVMGPPGSGKSTFINTLFNGKITVGGHGRTDVMPVICPHPYIRDSRLFIVEFPGFGHTAVDDAEILRKLSVWLAMSYVRDMKLAGVIYLHRIWSTPMIGTSRTNLQIFRKLWGVDNNSSVVLGTTRWSEVTESAGISRLEKLKKSLWSDLIQGGSEIFKFDDTQQSAWKMVSHLLQKGHINPVVLRIQEELVDLNHFIPSTDAGNELRNHFQVFYSMENDEVSQKQLQEALAAFQSLDSIPNRLKTFFGIASEYHSYQASEVVYHTEQRKKSAMVIMKEDFFSVNPSVSSDALEDDPEIKQQPRSPDVVGEVIATTKESRSTAGTFYKASDIEIDGCALIDGGATTVTGE